MQSKNADHINAMLSRSSVYFDQLYSYATHRGLTACMQKVFAHAQHLLMLSRPSRCILTPCSISDRLLCATDAGGSIECCQRQSAHPMLWHDLPVQRTGQGRHQKHVHG